MNAFVVPEDLEQHLEKVVPLIRAGGVNRQPIKATPWEWRDPSELPVREFVYGRHYARKFVSGTLSPGGLGKSSQEMVEAVAMATGRDLLGVKVREPLRVWYWNGEDPMDELDRRLAAICKHYGITSSDLGGRLFINSGRDSEIVVAREVREGDVIAEPVVAELEATIRDNAIDVWMFDPFVSVHEVSENDNNRIGAVMKALAGICDRTNTAADLVHHVRKSTAGTETTVHDGRGASAFLDRVRSARALNRMSKEEAERMSVEEEDRISIFRVDVGKANLFAPTSHTAWRKLQDVCLGNGRNGGPDDHVGVVTLWTPPSLLRDVRARDVLAIQQRINAGKHRDDVRAATWAGIVVAEVLDLDKDEPGNRARIRQMLHTWIKNGLLREVKQRDEQRRERTFIEVGKWIEP